MPDLDQIKQGKQGCGTGAGGLPGAGCAIPPPDISRHSAVLSVATTPAIEDSCGEGSVCR